MSAAPLPILETSTHASNRIDVNQDQRGTGVVHQAPKQQVTIRYDDDPPKRWNWAAILHGLAAVVRTAVVSGYRVEAHHWYDQGKRRLDIEIVHPRRGQSGGNDHQVHVTFLHTETRRGDWVFRNARLHRATESEHNVVELPRVRDVCTTLIEHAPNGDGDDG
jgi:hypothetical protein